MQRPLLRSVYAGVTAASDGLARAAAVGPPSRPWRAAAIGQPNQDSVSLALGPIYAYTRAVDTKNRPE